MITHKVSWHVSEARTPHDIALPARDRLLNMAQVEASGLLFHSCEKWAHGRPEFSFPFVFYPQLSDRRLIGVKEARHIKKLRVEHKGEREIRFAMSALQL